MLHCVVLYHNMSKYIILYSILHYVFHPVWAACNRYGTVCMDIIVIRRLDFLIDRPAKLDEQAMLYMIHGNSNIHGRYVAAVVFNNLMPCAENKFWTLGPSIYSKQLHPGHQAGIAHASFLITLYAISLGKADWKVVNWSSAWWFPWHFLLDFSFLPANMKPTAAEGPHICKQLAEAAKIWDWQCESHARSALLQIPSEFPEKLWSEELKAQELLLTWCGAQELMQHTFASFALIFHLAFVSHEIFEPQNKVMLLWINLRIGIFVAPPLWYYRYDHDHRAAKQPNMSGFIYKGILVLREHCDESCPDSGSS